MKTCTVILVSAIIFVLGPFMAVPNVFAEDEENPIKIFGYFQNSFQQWTAFENRPKQNSFSLQQLNLFFQKKLGSNWTAFINFEFLNNFSSGRQWGSMNLEEAWIKYRTDMRFNLKLGLLVPIFNNLNEIKNRTPLLPYIIRPLAYETSFSEFIPIELLIPVRAYGQVYGFFPVAETKFDYAVYIGNSPNISNNPLQGHTGADTTSTFLVGGRLGIRYRELKLGLSATYDKDNTFESMAEQFNIPRAELNEIPKTRLGGDLSYDFANFSLESEFIKVDIEKDNPEVKADLDLYYATLGYHFTEKLFIYSSYWVMDEHLTVLTANPEVKEDGDSRVYSLGTSYSLIDRISLKTQFSKVIKKEENYLITQGETKMEEDNFSVFGLAVSVFF